MSRLNTHGMPILETDQTTNAADRRLTSTYLNTRMHSRSASWSFAATQRASPSDLGTSLASINPIRSVIREFVPTLVPTSEQEQTSLHTLSRTNSQLSMGLGRGHWAGHDPNRQLDNTNRAGPNSLGRFTIGQNSGDNSSVSGDSQSSGNDREQPFVDNNSYESRDLNTSGLMMEGTGEDPLEVQGRGGGTNEISDGVQWIERNVLFFVLLVIRYFWLHRSGLSD